MAEPVPPPQRVLPVTPDEAPSTTDLESAAAAPPIPEITPHQTVLQQPWAQNVLPMLASIGLHLAIFLLAWTTYDAVSNPTPRSEEQIIVPDAAIVDADDPGALPNPGLGDDPTRAAAQDQFPDAASNSSSWSTTPSQTMQVALLGGGGEEENTDALIGLGAAGDFSRSIGTGSGLGSGAGDGTGQVAPFGVPGGGGGSAPKADFMGISGNARRVVFVCDATGTMLGNKEALLRRELRKAVDSLIAIQGFNIILFKGETVGGDFTIPFAPQLVVASTTNKAKAVEFINQFQVRASLTNPLPALHAAFDQKPQLIYFLSDGQFDNVVSYQQVIDEIKRLNPNGAVRVNTIAFLSEDAPAEEALRTIAQQNNGQFVKVTEADLF